MKEMIQLNLTEEESTILQSIVAVGVAVEPVVLERSMLIMKYFMREWPEANESLAIKMTKLVNINKDLIETKGEGVAYRRG